MTISLTVYFIDCSADLIVHVRHPILFSYKEANSAIWIEAEQLRDVVSMCPFMSENLLGSVGFEGVLEELS